MSKIQIKRSAEAQQGPTLGFFPTLVAHDEGLFAAEGVEIEYIVQQEAWHATPKGEVDLESVPSFGRHNLFEEGGGQVFGACEWGQVRRAHDSKRGGKIVGRNDGAQWHAIITSPEAKFKHPRELYNQPIAVRFHAGSHYATIELLEGFLEPEEINLVNLTHRDAFEAVTRGEIAAVTLPEPWITFAQKSGYLVLAETREFSAEIGAPSLDTRAYAAYNRARRKGAELLNANKEKYIRKYFDKLVGSLPEKYRGDLQPEDFNLDRLRWFGPQPYSQIEFERTYNWMVKRNLISSDSSYDKLVNREFLAVA